MDVYYQLRSFLYYHHHHSSCAVTPALFHIRYTSTSNPLSHSHPFPLLCLCTHMHPFTTHTPSSPPLDHVGETAALNLSSSSPYQSSVWTTNPQHIPPSLQLPLHAGIPLATVLVWWRLPSNQKAPTPSYMAYNVGGLQTWLDEDWSHTKDLMRIFFLWRSRVEVWRMGQRSCTGGGVYLFNLTLTALKCICGCNLPTASCLHCSLWIKLII